MLAACFLRHEDIPSFEWVFGEFTKSFGASPDVIFTDGDVKMAAAIDTKWKESRHPLYVSFMEEFLFP